MKRDPWHYGTWEGARDARREADLQRSLADKIMILEDMEQVAIRLHQQRRREGLPVDPRIAPLLAEPLAAEDSGTYHLSPSTDKP